MSRPSTSNSVFIWKYGKFLNSHMSMAEFCKQEGIDYLEFVEFANKWEERYGERMVETCMGQNEFNTGIRQPPEVRPSRAQHMFGEIMLVPDEDECRSRKRYPDNPALMAELDMARPHSTIRQASITFPGGARLEFHEATLKSLILTVILYEDFDTWAGK